jgi:hypothetical protein
MATLVTIAAATSCAPADREFVPKCDVVRRRHGRGFGGRDTGADGIGLFHRAGDGLSSGPRGRIVWPEIRQSGASLQVAEGMG